jgi:hypothetical protein
MSLGISQHTNFWSARESCDLPGSKARQWQGRQAGGWGGGCFADKLGYKAPVSPHARQPCWMVIAQAPVLLASTSRHPLPSNKRGSRRGSKPSTIRAEATNRKLQAQHLTNDLGQRNRAVKPSYHSEAITLPQCKGLSARSHSRTKPSGRQTEPGHSPLLLHR